MTFQAKLLIFWVLVFGVVWFARRFPHHPVSRTTHRWLGPYAVEGEHYSGFMARRAIWVFKCFLITALWFAACWVMASWWPEIAETWLFMLFAFALPLLGGTFLLASIIYGLSFAKQRIFGPDPTFQLPRDPPENLP